MKSAKVGTKKSLYVVKVLENKTLLPSAIGKVIEGANYSFEGAEIELTGAVAKDGEKYTFTARASEAKYTLAFGDDSKEAKADLDRLVGGGKTKVVLKGDYSEPEEKDKEGKKLPPVIEVTSAKEAKEPEKK